MNGLPRNSDAPIQGFRRSRPQPSSIGRIWKRVLYSTAPVLIFVTGGALFVFPSVDRLRSKWITQKIQYGSMQLAFTEHGTSQSVSNTDVVCRVKSRARGTSVASTLKWVIENGTPVQTGDVLARLDDSGFEEDLKVQRMNVTKARSDWIQAEENLTIVLSQNQGDLQTAQITLELAEIDLQKYLKGDYEQARQDVLGRLRLAESDREMWQDRVAWSGRMLKKGYLTSNQLQAEASQSDSSEIALDKVREELRILERFTKRRMLAELESNVAEARRASRRVKCQARAKELRAKINRLKKQSIYNLEAMRLRDIEEQIANCTIVAPHDGMVVYYTSEQSQYGSGSQQTIIAQGEPVREGQRLMQIPDLSQMELDTQVHESMLPYVHGEEWTPTGFCDSVQAAMLTQPNLLSRLVGQNAFGHFRGKLRNLELRRSYPGERAVILVHAFPDKVLHGHVKHVSVIPSQQDWILTDLKVFRTIVSLDEPFEELKPGMTADVTILADRPLEHVLTIPMEAIFGAPRHGGPGKCFVLTDDGPQEREIVTGLSDDTIVEIKNGLQEGEEVVLNPAALLSEGEEHHGY